MADLFVLEDLAALLQQDLDAASARVCRQVVTGLVLGETRRVELPDPVPAGLASIGLRVAGRLYVNPGELASEIAGNYTAFYTAADLTDGEQRALKPYKSSSAISVPLANRCGEVLEIPTA